jgi:hypothetical protein
MFGAWLFLEHLVMRYQGMATAVSARAAHIKATALLLVSIVNHECHC